MHVVPVQAKEAITCPEIGVTAGCEPPFKCWELNNGPLEEQLVLKTFGPSCKYLDFLFSISFHLTEVAPPPY